jgi:hypothetical protein
MNRHDIIRFLGDPSWMLIAAIVLGFGFSIWGVLP